MTDLCRGSGAHADATLGGLVTVTAAAVEGALVRFMPRNVAQFLSPFLAGVTYELDTVCSSPAPDPVNLTQDDLAALADYLNLLTFTPAVEKTKNWFLSWYWQFLCRCNDGAAPGAAANPNVTGTLSTSPQLPTGVVGNSCWNSTVTIPVTVPGVFSFNQVEPKTTDVPGWSTASGFPPQRLPQPKPTSLSLRARLNNNGDLTERISTQLQFRDINGVVVPTEIDFGQVGPDVDQIRNDFVIPATAEYVDFHSFYSVQHTTGARATGQLQYFCGGSTSTTPVVECCPPDPMLVSMLNQVYGLVTLIQRQVAPFAYVPGATHAGLTGAGEIVVQGLLGVKVLPASIPPGAGVDLGDPDTLWLDSWINWGNPDGWTNREWLRASPHVSLPALAGQFTKIGYTLRPGLTVDLIELKSEP